jgi:hypothetical protein
MIYVQESFSAGSGLATYQVLQRRDFSCQQSGWEWYLARNYYLKEEWVNVYVSPPPPSGNSHSEAKSVRVETHRLINALLVEI